ncbi:hypothetical protein JHK85_046315 [Glycine max]|nr:hypothetical protein JHK85_046315 [Glycine max]
MHGLAPAREFRDAIEDHKRHASRKCFANVADADVSYLSGSSRSPQIHFHEPSYATHRIGLFALFGPFVLGLATPEGPPLGTAITKKIDSFVNWVLMPTFVTTCAMRVDLRDFMNWREKMNGGIGEFTVQTLVII